MEEDEMAKEHSRVKQAVKRKAPSHGGPEPSKREKTASSKTTHARTTFLDLPAELRNEIYELLLVDGRFQNLVHLRCRNWAYDPLRSIFTHEPIMIRIDHISRICPAQPALLRVCRKTRREAAPMYYGTHCFEVEIENFSNINTVVEWIHGITKLCGNEAFGNMNIEVHMPDADNLEDLRPLIQLLYKTEIRLIGRPVTHVGSKDGQRYEWFTPSPLLGFPYRTCSFLSNPFTRFGEAVVTLAREAKEEGWAEDVFDVEISRLFSKQQAKVDKLVEARRRKKKGKEL